ncbi:arylsulfatase, partial [Reticulomyxa filosa]
ETWLWVWGFLKKKKKMSSRSCYPRLIIGSILGLVWLSVLALILFQSTFDTVVFTPSDNADFALDLQKTRQEVTKIQRKKENREEAKQQEVLGKVKNSKQREDSRTGQQKKENIPNILYVLLDDVGWSDVGYHETNARVRVHTPHLNELATKEGVILNQYYTYQICSPTRASLLTGRYNIHNRVSFVIGPTDKYGLPLDEIVLPQMLKRFANFRTYLVGKWHLGFYANHYTPPQRHFDYFYGFYLGEGDHFLHSRKLPKQFAYDLRIQNATTKAEGVYSSWLFGNVTKAILQSYVSIPNNKNNNNKNNNNKNNNNNNNNNNNKKDPFFILLSFQVVHDPPQCPEAYVTRYNDQSRYNMSATRRVRAGMMTLTDDVIEELVSVLKANDGELWNNTLVVVASDNGATDNAGNRPLRGAKHTLWEGGIRVPAFVTGGALHPSLKGKIHKHMFHVSDWFATFVDMCGIDVMLDYNDVVPLNNRLDGVSQYPFLFQGRDHLPLRHEMLLGGFDANDGGAIRVGELKFVSGSPVSVNAMHKSGWTPSHLDFRFGHAHVQCATHHNIVPPTTLDNCVTGSPCVFNLTSDPCEYAPLDPTRFATLYQELEGKLALHMRSALPVIFPDAPLGELIQLSPDGDPFWGPIV